MATHQLIATCTFGLEAVVVRQLQALGFADAKTRSTGRVVFTGDDLAIARANIHLRCAERVLVEVGRFEATDFGQLYDRTFAGPWDKWIGPENAFPVNGRSVKSQLSSVPACQKIVKKAIVDKLLKAHGVKRLPETGPRAVVEVALLENQVSVTLDTSGQGLHKRGYRQLTAAAPLRETLAAAMIMLSFWNPKRPLLDPFCGSGTIPIEAAMIGRNIAPGLHRKFDAQQWAGLAPAIWDQVRREAEAQILDGLPERILATDINTEVLSLARYHARKAGVENDIHFQQADFADLTSQRKYGCIITNPPFGKRMGDEEEIEDLYRSIPLVLRKLPTWSHYIFTGYQGFERLLGRPADRRRKLYSAQIECTYYQFHGPRPPRSGEPAEPAGTGETAATAEPNGSGAVDSDTQVAPTTEPTTEATSAATAGSAPKTPATNAEATSTQKLPAAPHHTEVQQAFGGLNAKAHKQAEIFANRLRKTARHLRRWPTRRGISCFRLYDRDIPEVPLVVDRYEDHLHMAEHERPHERSVAQHADWLDLMVKTAARTLEISPGNVFLKQRGRQRGLKQYNKAADDHYQIVVTEGGLKFQVNLSDYVDTGLFLDHRITRSMFADRASGKDVLNLFCYTGAFSVYAAAAGAASTTNVDSSNTYLDWARHNLDLNQLAGPNHKFIKTDIFKFLEGRAGKAGNAAKAGKAQLPPKTSGPESFDLAIIDPPTFSNSKSTTTVWDIQKDHSQMLQSVLAMMRPGGQIFFSTNFRTFKLDEPALSETDVREITSKTLPEDFRNKRIHRCWTITKPGAFQTILPVHQKAH